MTSELYIENKRLDLSDEISTLLTFQIDDVKDIGYRNSSLSKTVIIPGTANNNALFGHIYDVRVSNPYNPAAANVEYNFNASKAATAIAFNDHIQTFKGILRLLRVVIVDGVPEYECALFGELVGLVNAIANKKIEELDFSAYDHTFNATGITSSWDNNSSAPGSGIYYPLIDYGNVSNNKVDYQINTFRPALYVKELIEKIFSDAGYTFDCDLFDTERFKRLIVPMSSDLRSLQSDLVFATRSSNYTVISSLTPADDDDLYEFQTVTTTSAAFTTNVNKDRITYVDTPNLNCDLFFHFSGFRSSLRPIYLQVLINGSVFFQQMLLPGVGNWSWANTLNLSLNQNNYIEFQFVQTDPSFASFNLQSDFADVKITSSIPVFVPVAYGDTVVMNQTLPKNIKQYDFLTSVIKLFNLYVYEDTLKNKFLNIKPQVDFYDLNVSGVVDWTYKMDRSKAITITPMGEINARYYEFKFKSDSDYYNDFYRKRFNQGFGDYLFDSEFQFNKDKTDIEIIFSASVLVSYTGCDKIVSSFYKLNAQGIEQPFDVNIRILQSKKITGVTAWNILDTDGVTVLFSGYTSYGYAGNYDDPDAPANDIHFGVPKEVYFTVVTGAVNVTQFNVYWSTYMAEISDKDSKLLTAFFKLNTRDIYGLDFSKMIYVDGSYFALNKVEDWNANYPDVCRVELLKRINTVY